jgi:uncharacterized protein
MKDQYVAYRLVRAWQTYEDAIVLFERNSFNSSINRLYYASFYSAIAALSSKGITAKTHNGIKRKIGQLVLTNQLDKSQAKTFGLLSDLRHKGDYDDLYNFDKAIVERLLEPTKRFIESMESFCNSSQDNN